VQNKSGKKGPVIRAIGIKYKKKETKKIGLYFLL
jgi:hypothetical protein